MVEETRTTSNSGEYGRMGGVANMKTIKANFENDKGIPKKTLYKRGRGFS